MTTIGLVIFFLSETTSDDTEFFPDTARGISRPNVGEEKDPAGLCKGKETNLEGYSGVFLGGNREDVG